MEHPAETEHEAAHQQQQEKMEKQQKKTSAAANKKYGKMANADDAGRAFDNGGAKRDAGDTSTVKLSKEKLKGTLGLKLEARQPQKKLTSTAPPEMAGAAAGGTKSALSAAAPKAAKPTEREEMSSDYDYKFSKIFDSKANSAAQSQAQDEKKVREAQFGVAIATREEHAKITKALINHTGIGGVIPVVYDFIPGGVVADCVSGKCTDGSGAWGKVVQLVTGTKSPRSTGEGYYTKTEIACAGLGDITPETWTP